MDDLLAEAAAGAVAIMCSETVWWRCHRRLVSDVAVLLHAVPVEHLAHNGRRSPHPPSAGARVSPDGLRYDRMGDQAQDEPESVDRLLAGGPSCGVDPSPT